VKKILAIVFLLAAVVITYAPAVRNGFVWDDTALILRDPLIRSWRLIHEGFNHFLFVDATASDFYRPLQRLTYTIDYAAFAFRPAGYHLVSIFWHAAAAVVLFFFAVEFLRSFDVAELKSFWIALLTALVWAIHPIQSAAVIYVSGRADPLAVTFGFVGLYLILRQTRAFGLTRWLFIFSAGIAFLLSALSKESGLIFPLLAIVLFALRKKWSDVFKTVAATAFVCAIYFSLRFGAEHFPAPQLTPPAPALVRPIIVARAVAEYAGLIVFPLNLHMDRDVESHPHGSNEASFKTSAWRELQTLLGILLIAGLIWWMLRARQHNQAVFAALVLALIGYLPISGLVSLNATVAEHWMYLPSAFLFLAVVISASRLFEPQSPRRSTIASATAVLAVAWIIFLGVRTFVRTFDWKDQRTFFERTIADGGDSARMLINLGSLELNEGKLEDAAIHLHSALEKKPDQPLAIVDLAAVALKQSDFKLARQLLNRATQVDLVAARANELLAILESKESGKVDLMRLRLASKTGTPNWEIERRYIKVLDETGARAAAINELLTCLQTQWYRAESWQLLSELETEAGHADQAANAQQQACLYDVHLSSAN
jgi:tetratricopeptide (TPR) repeat protein